MEEPTYELELPGFRFHPTEEELLGFYLKNMIFGKILCSDVIGFLNIYLHEPWDLPGLAKIGEREWYFFVQRDRKHGSGGRPNRTTATGFWKATGSDRKIFSLSDSKKMIGLKKTLVFYEGRAPHGCRTDWIMNEYRLPDTCPSPKDIVLCKIYRKATSLKVLEERAAMEKTMESISFSNEHEDYLVDPMAAQHLAFKKEEHDLEIGEVNKYEVAEESYGITTSNNNLKLPSGKLEKLGELQVPTLSAEWTQDPFWTQLRSPWLDNVMNPYPHLLNF